MPETKIFLDKSEKIYGMCPLLRAHSTPLTAA